METNGLREPIRIALTSTSPLSGKSTLAKWLEKERGFIRLDHARTLVEALVENWNKDENMSGPTSIEEVYQNKEFWRPLLQEYGYMVGFHDPDRAESWVMRSLAPWLSDQSRNVVFEPVRSEEQAEILRHMGFTLVQLHIPAIVRRVRAEEMGKDYQKIVLAMRTHPELEGGIKKPDIRLSATQPTHIIGQRLLTRMEVQDATERREIQVPQ